jgi:pimeloyl-ACP methyl ester carboxylesterase
MDWRGHGGSEAPRGEFGLEELVEDARAVIKASRADQVVPVATAHAGWVAIELRRRLGLRIPRLVLVEWIVLGPPPQFLEALAGLQVPDRWQATRERLFALWLGASTNPALSAHIRGVMQVHGFPMWARAGREIGASYAAAGSPLQALSMLSPAVPTLHLYCLPKDPAYHTAQTTFAASHAWFHVERLAAKTHFPVLEAPDAVAASIERFAG